MPGTVALFENRVFADDQVKVRSEGPWPNRTSVFLIEGNLDDRQMI